MRDVPKRAPYLSSEPINEYRVIRPAALFDTRVPSTPSPQLPFPLMTNNTRQLYPVSLYPTAPRGRTPLGPSHQLLLPLPLISPPYPLNQLSDPQDKGTRPLVGPPPHYSQGAFEFMRLFNWIHYYISDLELIMQTRKPLDPVCCHCC